MRGKEVAELIVTAYETKNPNNAIALFNFLCDEFDFPHFAEYERGYTVGKNGREIEDDISELVKVIEKKLKGTEELKTFYDNLEESFLCYIEDDNVKFEKYKKLGIYLGEVIAKSIKSEKIKMYIINEAISKGQFNRVCIEILAKINNDKFKEEVLGKTKNEDYKDEIVTLFNSDELKLKYLDNVSDKNRFKVICSFSSDELKLKFAKGLDKDKMQQLLVSLKSDELKIKNMDPIDIIVIKSLKSDDKKINWLLDNKKYLTDKDVYAILYSLKSDNKRLQNIELLKDRIYKIKLLDRAKRPNLTLLMQTCNKLGINIFNELINSNNGIYPNNYNRKWKEIGLPKDMTFGIEIEAAGEYAFLYTQFPHINKVWDATNESRDMHYPDANLMYIVEASSPILRDQEENVKDIYRICTLLKNGGLEIEENCGGHIHIGADYLTSKESYERLIELWCNCEKIFFEICDEPNSIKRYTYDDYATPISNILKEGKIESKYSLGKEDFIRELQEIQGDRYKSINFANVGKKASTIEFRIPNGTLNPNVWIENVRLFGRLMQISEELGKLDKKDPNEYTSEDRRKMWISTMLTNENVPENDKAKFLINLLFDEEEYKKIYFKRYNTNKGQFKAEKFSILDFKNLYRELNHMQSLKESRGKENGTKDEDSFERG